MNRFVDVVLQRCQQTLIFPGVREQKVRVDYVWVDVLSVALFRKSFLLRILKSSDKTLNYQAERCESHQCNYKQLHYCNFLVKSKFGKF